MLTDGAEGATEIDQSLPVEFQDMNGGPPGRRQAEHLREIFAPGKVITPSLLSRMIKRHAPLGERVYACNLRVLGTVAALAGESQVIQSIVTALLARVYMLHAEGLRREIGWTRQYSQRLSARVVTSALSLAVTRLRMKDRYSPS